MLLPAVAEVNHRKHQSIEAASSARFELWFPDIEARIASSRPR
jgi:hypothetical protein